MPRHVTVEDHDGIALVRIDRPPANAMDLELLEDGAAVLEDLGADLPDAVVLTGRAGFFSAGVDLKLAPTLDADAQRDMVAGINRAFAGARSIRTSAMPSRSSTVTWRGIGSVNHADERTRTSTSRRTRRPERRASANSATSASSRSNLAGHESWWPFTLHWQFCANPCRMGKRT